MIRSKLLNLTFNARLWRVLNEDFGAVQDVRMKLGLARTMLSHGVV